MEENPANGKAAAGYTYGRIARGVVEGFADFDPLFGVVEEVLSDGDAASSCVCSAVGGVLGKRCDRTGEDEEVDSHGTKRMKKLYRRANGRTLLD